MNRVSVIMPNPAHIEEVELDRDEVDPADLTPLISGETPFITVPALEVEDTAEEAVEDKDGDVAEEFVKDDDEEDVPHILRKAIQNRIEPGVKEYIVPRGHKLSTAYCCPQC